MTKEKNPAIQYGTRVPSPKGSIFFYVDGYKHYPRVLAILTALALAVGCSFLENVALQAMIIILLAQATTVDMYRYLLNRNLFIYRNIETDAHKWADRDFSTREKALRKKEAALNSRENSIAREKKMLQDAVDGLTETSKMYLKVLTRLYTLDSGRCPVPSYQYARKCIELGGRIYDGRSTLELFDPVKYATLGEYRQHIDDHSEEYLDSLARLDYMTIHRISRILEKIKGDGGGGGSVAGGQHAKLKRIEKSADEER